MLNVDSKARSVAFTDDSAFVAFHNNNIRAYSLEEEGKAKNSVDLEYHQQAIRQLQLADTDRTLVTASFDAIKFWDVDFSSNSQKVQVSH